MASSGNTDEESSLVKKEVVEDKYRSFLSSDDPNTTIQWRHGGPPTYDSVNLLFEQGRTKVITTDHHKL